MEATDVNHHINASLARVLESVGTEGISDVIRPVDVQAVRLLLNGGSVVDWRRLLFRERSEVVGFLSVNGYDVSSPVEMERLSELHARALDYVEATYALTLPDVIRAPADPCDLFLAASGVAASRSEQRAACTVLKVMHVINHLEARRLVHHLSLSERDLFLAAATKVDEVIRSLHDAGMAIREYVPSTKTDHSLITKLISKPRVTAAQIFDKLRFRLVTERREDLIHVAQWLLRHLFPFNHVIAGESHNTILSPGELLEMLEGRMERPLPSWVSKDVEESRENPASSPSFRMINFVVDLPVRIERLCPPEDLQRLQHLGHLVHVTFEFQLFDQATVEASESGAGNHSAYKQRQLKLVSERLWGGLRPQPGSIDALERPSRQRFDPKD